MTCILTWFNRFTERGMAEDWTGGPDEVFRTVFYLMACILTWLYIYIRFTERDMADIWTGGSDEVFGTVLYLMTCILTWFDRFTERGMVEIWTGGPDELFRTVLYLMTCILTWFIQVHRERHGWDLNRWSRWRVYRMTTSCVWKNRNVWKRKRSTLSWLDYLISWSVNCRTKRVRAWTCVFSCDKQQQ